MLFNALILLFLPGTVVGWIIGVFSSDKKFDMVNENKERITKREKLIFIF